MFSTFFMAASTCGFAGQSSRRFNQVLNCNSFGGSPESSGTRNLLFSQLIVTRFRQWPVVALVAARARRDCLAWHFHKADRSNTFP
jgi:hypothetical protein